MPLFSACTQLLGIFLFCREKWTERAEGRSHSSTLSSGSSSRRNPAATLLSPLHESHAVQISIVLSPHLTRLHCRRQETHDLQRDVSTLRHCSIKKYLVTYSGIHEHLHSLTRVEITQMHSKESGRGVREQVNCCPINLCNRNYHQVLRKELGISII